MKSKLCSSGRLAGVIVAFAFMLACTVVNASPVVISLSGVVFDDGGKIVDGSSFTLNQASQTVGNVDISTTPGSGVYGPLTGGQAFPGQSGYAYSSADSCFSYIHCGNSAVLGDLTLGFTFSNATLSLHFDVATDGTLSFIGVGEDYNGGGSFRGAGTEVHTAWAQYASLGTLTVTPLATIPEPSTLSLLGLALVGFAASRRKRIA